MHNPRMATVLSFLFRLLVLVAGLVFAASLFVAFLVVATLWLARRTWARLTGRPVRPFAMRMSPRGGFAFMMRRAPATAAAGATRTPRADAAGLARRHGDITDVQAK